MRSWGSTQRALWEGGLVKVDVLASPTLSVHVLQLLTQLVFAFRFLLCIYRSRRTGVNGEEREREREREENYTST